jgi:hypothetical protein
LVYALLAGAQSAGAIGGKVFGASGEAKGHCPS